MCVAHPYGEGYTSLHLGVVVMCYLAFSFLVVVCSHCVGRLVLFSFNCQHRPGVLLAQDQWPTDCDSHYDVRFERCKCLNIQQTNSIFTFTPAPTCFSRKAESRKCSKCIINKDN